MATTDLHGGRKRVVIVEDNVAAAQALCRLLEFFGQDVRVAYTGPEGVRVAIEWPPDFVLCDIGLPGPDGYGVADVLRQHPATTKTQLIAITGDGSDEARRQSREAGFERHYVKPVEPGELLRLLAGHPA
jgi:CheY-like chemotaxis protein